MPNKTINFTKTAIKALPLPKKGKRSYYKDSKETGLIVDVRPSGSKSFYLYKKINGKPERILLGPFPDISVENARKAAAHKKSEIAHGKNPQDEKRKIKQETTFGDFFDEYIDRYSRPHKKTWQDDIRVINKYLAHWFERRISDIRKHEVQKLHDTLKNRNGLYQANRVLERIGSIYNKAIEWGWDGENPAKGIRKFKEKARDRFIQPSELPLVFEALEIEENGAAKDFILISLMTGARRSNVLAMRWEEVNWEHKSWRIPETKNGETVTIPLIPQALEILRQRKDVTTSPWVFEGRGKTGHLSDPKSTWNRIKQRATLLLWKQDQKLRKFIEDTENRIRNQNNYGYTVLKLVDTITKEAEKKGIALPTGLMDVRLHDLRRTFGSYQAITGASLPIIGKTLGHKTASTTAIYARLHDDPIRDSMEKAANAIFGGGYKADSK